MNTTLHSDELANARATLAEDPQSLIDLKPMPVVAMKVSQACRDQKVDIRALTKLVETDAAFSTKILSVSNSAIYAHTREIVSINQALVVLGRRNVVQLALSIAARQVFDSSSEAAEAQGDIYLHSLGCAATAGAIIRHSGASIDPGAAFLAGVLHDVGKLVLLELAPKTYISRVVDAEFLVPTTTVEQEIFGVDHTTLGSLFGDYWQLSDEIKHAIAQHHATSPAGERAPLTEIIRLANQLTKLWGVGQPEQSIICEETDGWIQDQSEEEIEAIRLLAVEYYRETKALLG